jgi:hypothetical protein
MYNAKAFLEGLIVNEVLTKTASFEKLAQQPGMFSPNWVEAIGALQTQRAAQRAADAAHREAFSQQRKEINDLQKQREDLGLNPLLQRMPPAQRAIIARRIREGKLPTEDEIRTWAQKYPGRPKNISPAGPASKATTPGMEAPGIKPPASPPYPPYPPYLPYPPSPSPPTPPTSDNNIKA